MNIRETVLVPVLVELTSECCDELLEEDKVILKKEHFFKEDEYTYIYKCSKCGRLFERNNPLKLKRIGFKNIETGENFLVKGFRTNGSLL